MTQIHPLVRHLSRAFEQSGFRLYLVGGSVRDALLQREAPDLDFTTDAEPAGIRHALQRARPDSIFGIGERFGTIGAVFGEMVVEVTTFRSEQYEPQSRHPTVQFGTSLEADLARRDFTINAMAIDARNVGELARDNVIDPYGGLSDLDSGVLRAVGNARERFEEDPLRLLRAERFAAQLGFQIEPDTRAAIREAATSLADISTERISAEFQKLLVSPHPDDGLRSCVEDGLMPFILPELLALRSKDPSHKDIFRHTLQVVSRTPPTLIARWSGLLHDIAKPRTKGVDSNGEIHFRLHERVGAAMTREILARLKVDKGFAEQVALVVALHTRANSYDHEWTDAAMRRFLREADGVFDVLVQLSRADVTSSFSDRVAAAEARADALESRARELLAREDVLRLDSPLDGNALMAMFDRKPGPWIKDVKQYLLDEVLEGRLGPDDTEAATALAKDFVGQGH